MINENELEKRLRKHVYELSCKIGERHINEISALDRTKNYIVEIFNEYENNIGIQPYFFKEKTVSNIVSYKNLSDNDKKNYYLIGAHYDSEKGTPGADDNASGIAVLLECGRLCAEAKFKKPVKFVCFTLEEKPAFLTENMGSRVYIENSIANNETILGAIILEMVGYTSKKQTYPFPLNLLPFSRQGNFLCFVGNYKSRKFVRRIIKPFKNSTDLPVEKILVPGVGQIAPITRRSDHSAFWDKNIPAVMLTDTSFLRNPNYHKHGDTYETLDFDFMKNVAIGLFNVIKNIN